MFRVTSEERIESFPSADRILRITLFMALLAGCGSIYLSFQEHRRVSSWVDDADPLIPTNLELLKQQHGLRLTAGLVVLGLLLICQIAMWKLRHEYLVSRQSLHHVKMLAHDILASMDRGVVTTNCAEVITSINSAGIKLLGVDFECVGKPVRSISSPEVPLEKVCGEVLRNHAPICDRDSTIEREGRTLRIRLDAHVLPDSAGAAAGCVIYLRDVTERMLLEEQMRRMERFLSIAMLASGLHHEIKNPLTALSIHIQLLEELLSSDESDSRVDEIVGVLKTEVYRLNGVLESFRTFANLQQLVLQPTDVLKVVENVIRLIQPQATEQRIALNFVRPERRSFFAQLDADKFEQAILNLVINALEAMPNGGILTIKVSDMIGTVRVAIEDTGFGIPPEVRRNLFRPYFSTKSKGSGIGLALSEKLIGQHKGHIEYRTRVGASKSRRKAMISGRLRQSELSHSHRDVACAVHFGGHSAWMPSRRNSLRFCRSALSSCMIREFKDDAIIY